MENTSERRLFYHVSPAANRASILKHGLLAAGIPGERGRPTRAAVFMIKAQPVATYLTDDASGAEFYCTFLWKKFRPNKHGRLHSLDVWQVSLDAEQADGLEKDDGWISKGARRLYETVPPERLRLIVSVGRMTSWVPLADWPV
jgi:hypothetical protein